MARVEDRTVPADWNSQFFEGLKMLQTGMESYTRNALLNKQLDMEKALADMKYGENSQVTKNETLKSTAQYIQALNNAGTINEWDLPQLQKETGSSFVKALAPVTREERQGDVAIEKINKKAAADYMRAEYNKKMDFIKEQFKQGKIDRRQYAAQKVQLAVLGTTAEDMAKASIALGTPPDETDTTEPTIPEEVAIPKPTKNNWGKSEITIGNIIDVIGTDALDKPVKGGKRTPRQYLEFINSQPEEKRNELINSLLVSIPGLKKTFEKKGYK